MDKKRIAVIPARGGSKRIPRKNIRDFCGKPMIAWSIEAATASGLFDHIIISTDDAEIAEIAINLGAEVPFMRPPELSDDHTGTTEVVAHAVRWMLDQGISIDAVCCIYATAPLILADDLIQGFEIIKSASWSYSFTATDYAAPIFRSFQQTKSGSVEMIFPEYFLSRSQDLPRVFHDAGQFYWGRPDAWLNGECIFGASAKPLIIPRWRVQDIDTEEDFKRAELMFMAIKRTHPFI